MKKKLNEKQQLMSYVLSTDADLNSNKKITQSEIAKIFGVTQPTVSASNAKTALKLENNNLRKQLTEAKQEIKKLADSSVIEIPDNITDEYRRQW